MLYRSLVANPGTGFYVDADRKVVRNLEVPSGGGVGTARAIAKAYGVFAAAARELGLRAETIDALKAPAMPPRHGFFDECFRGPAQFSLGFMKPASRFPSGTTARSARREPAARWATPIPRRGIGYGYVTNRMGMNLQGDRARRGATRGDAGRRSPVRVDAARDSRRTSKPSCRAS